MDTTDEPFFSPEEVTIFIKLIVANALYFNDTWENQFNPAQTRQEPFYPLNGLTKQVPMMHLTTHMKYINTPDLQVVKLPGAIATFIMGPPSLTSPQDPMDRDFEIGELLLPRFTIDKQTNYCVQQDWNQFIAMDLNESIADFFVLTASNRESKLHSKRKEEIGRAHV